MHKMRNFLFLHAHVSSRQNNMFQKRTFILGQGISGLLAEMDRGVYAQSCNTLLD